MDDLSKMARINKSSMRIKILCTYSFVPITLEFFFLTAFAFASKFSIVPRPHNSHRPFTSLFFFTCSSRIRYKYFSKACEIRRWQSVLVYFFLRITLPKDSTKRSFRKIITKIWIRLVKINVTKIGFRISSILFSVTIDICLSCIAIFIKIKITFIICFSLFK